MEDQKGKKSKVQLNQQNNKLVELAQSFSH